ncbi:MAG: hypothetical protein Q9213_006009 [Squamulea squamosa]
MSKEKFERNKLTVNIGVIGHADHGRTTLTAAIASVLAETYGGSAKTLDAIDSGSREKAGGVIINTSRIDYETPTRHYKHVDFVSHKDVVKSMITGGAQMDGVILVVAGTDGPMPQVGIPYIIVFINKCDMINDEELLELVEMETRDLLSQYDYPGDDTPIVRGSALGALQGDAEWESKVMGLADFLDNYVPDPEWPRDQPFLLPIEEIISDQDIVISGRVERGVIKATDAVELVGLKDAMKPICTSIENQSQKLDYGCAGDNIHVHLQGLKPADVMRGQVLAKPGSIQACSTFESEVYVFSQDEGGRATSFDKEFHPQFCIRTALIGGTITLPEDVVSVNPGDCCQLVVSLDKSIPLDVGLYFSIYESDKEVGKGVVSKFVA